LSDFPVPHFCFLASTAWELFTPRAAQISQLGHHVPKVRADIWALPSGIADIPANYAHTRFRLDAVRHPVSASYSTT